MAHDRQRSGDASSLEHHRIILLLPAALPLAAGCGKRQCWSGSAAKG
jgi:hypothetical protein